MLHFSHFIVMYCLVLLSALGEMQIVFFQKSGMSKDLDSRKEFPYS